MRIFLRCDQLKNMNIPVWIVCLFIRAGCSNMLEEQNTKHQQYSDLKLTYSCVGLGSNFGRKAPTFKAMGRRFVLILQQNSFLNQPNKSIDTICSGLLRITSIDSIINLLEEVKDTQIYRTNAGIMSGDIQTISILTDSINTTFTLHNATDPILEKLVQILNSNLPLGKRRLVLFEDIAAMNGT